MVKKETFYLSVMNFSRSKFRNTWIHHLPFTTTIYRKMFSATYHGVDKNIVFRNLKFKVPTTDTTVVPSMISGDFEKIELDIFHKLLKKNDIVLDIGANIGVYCAEAATAIGARGKVYAFEPVTQNLELLKHNLKINHITNVEIIDAAVGSEEGKLKIYLAENSIATHSAGKVSNKSTDVDVVTIDSFVKKKKFKKVDMIKMDIEGYEGYAIEGGLQTIKKYQPILFIEFSADHLKRCGYDPRKQASQLLKLYKYCYHIDEQKNIFRKINKIDDIVKLRNDNLVLAPHSLSQSWV